MATLKLSKEYVYSVAKTCTLVFTNNGNDYLSAPLRFNGHRYTVYKHVLIFYIHNGYIPARVDHIDGNTLNNEPLNLRAATVSQNNHNRRINSNNKTGFKGVRKKFGKYEARVQCGGASHYLGLFDTPEEANEAACNKRAELHGKFAKHI